MFSSVHVCRVPQVRGLVLDANLGDACPENQTRTGEWTCQ